MQKLTDSYVYLRLCWNEALGHLRVPIDMFEKGSIAFLVLKAMDVNYAWALPLAAVIGMLIIFYIGHLSIKHGLT